MCQQYYYETFFYEKASPEPITATFQLPCRIIHTFENQAGGDIIVRMIDEKPQAENVKAEINDTSLTLEEAIRKYHSPDENALYSVTLWGGVHFEGVRECMNEMCVNRDKKIPVGKLCFWQNDFGDGSWFFFCSEGCKTEVYKIWYAKAQPSINGVTHFRRERIYNEKKCEQCQKQFIPAGGAQKYCPDCIGLFLTIAPKR